MMVCKRCGNIVSYNSYFRAYYCSVCGEYFDLQYEKSTNREHVNYTFLCNADVDLEEFGNSIQIDISNNKKFLRVTLFKDDHYQDEIKIDLIDEFGD